MVASINVKLIDALAHIILSLAPEERQLLEEKIQLSTEEIQSRKQALQREIAIGLEQLESGNYTEYDDSSLLGLLEAIKKRSPL